MKVYGQTHFAANVLVTKMSPKIRIPLMDKRMLNRPGFHDKAMIEEFTALYREDSEPKAERIVTPQACEDF